ncbi:MAG: 4-hydroxythreonine-4-phosphate dehydrogenase PdxA [bacterium]|nr:4-hydroxythreonine-4-phosphate dehydrogenase PdxA [bacterium]
MKPVIGITMGDAGGIGPEVIAKALDSVAGICHPLVIGEKNTFFRYRKIRVIEDISQIAFNEPNLLDLKNLSKIGPGRFSLRTGRASYEYILKCFPLLKEKKIEAMVTAPICKEAMNLAGLRFAGHTDLLASLSKSKVAMMFVSEPLKVTLATIHIPLADVPSQITKDRVYQAIKLSNSCLTSDFKIKEPKILVLGLNPHAGEGGLFGREEEEIKKAIKRAIKEGMSVEGPLPPDTAFLKKADCFVVMYHDQGLIPLKMLAFDTAVNLTLGIPFIRTSPDHGCGFDIAGKNMASPTSMIEAIRLAVRLCKQ